ncbi:uncharacterized protein LOC106468885 [Limulus polyphemus]|uniref:Uncharacterized protein LOC106468885 n=1 Tax=Limulus polyphemus TaxID=6850 RepID=A0ABM1TAQ1_LIMPO|nr:uncharacterized protein LOC106468885 [Limulus polyphemus]XP_022252957.1 uncharacterized protein LOC106468885 [Limulus polyphemus]
METKSSEGLLGSSVTRNFSQVNNMNQDAALLGLGLGMGLLSVLVILFVIRRVRQQKRLAMKYRASSRDSLDPTEYMKMLASIDGKIGMMKIFEKRHQIPEIACNDLGYIDEVFVDIRELANEKQKLESSENEQTKN